MASAQRQYTSEELIQKLFESDNDDFSDIDSSESELDESGEEFEPCERDSVFFVDDQDVEEVEFASHATTHQDFI